MTRYATRIFGAPIPFIPAESPLPAPTPGKLYSYSVVVAGVEQFCLAGSLQIQSKIGKRSQASCTLRTTTAVHFQQDQRIQIFDSNNTLRFNGYVDKPKEQKRGFQKFLIHTITAVDGHRLADKRRAAKVYTNETAGAMAYDLWNVYLRPEGVTIGAIFDGPTPSSYLYPSESLYPGENIVATIPSALFAYPKVSEALDALAKQASYAGIPFYWQIDELLHFWFVPYTYVKYGQLVNGDTIDERTVSVVRNNPTYFNTKWITGATVETDPQTETRLGDGETTSWNMSYPLTHVPTVSVNSVAKTVGIQGVETGKNFYWNSGSTTISQDTGDTKLTSSDTLQVVYIGSYPTTFYAQDTAQVAYEQDVDQSSGIVEDVEENASITSFEAGVNAVSEALNQNAKQGLTLSFETLDPTFQQGQLITCDLPDFAIDRQDLLIESVTASDQKDGMNIWYTVIAIQGPVDTTWVDFFSKLLKTPQKVENISIGVSQVLNTLETFTAKVNLTATLTIKAFGGLSPSETLYPANDLFPS
jgi:hypothetical protein